MKTYDLIKQILTDHPETRDSDMKLIWKVWEHDLGHELYEIPYELFTQLRSTETIRRTRQKVQQHNEQLKPSEKVKEFRQEREDNWAEIFY